MTRPIFIIAICFMSISCNKNSKPAESISATTTDNPTKTDTTEIDFIKSSPDKAKIVLENEFVRVIEYSLKPGEKDSTHTHPPKTSYVISGGTLRVYPKKRARQ